MSIHTIRVFSIQEDPSPDELAVLHSIQQLGITSVPTLVIETVYRLEGLSEGEARSFAKQALVDPLTQSFNLNDPFARTYGEVEVGYKPGVMNPAAASILKMARDLGYPQIVAADTSTNYIFLGMPPEGDIQAITDQLLVNKTVSRVVTEEPKTLMIEGTVGSVATIPLRETDDAALVALSKDKLFLNLEEMKIVRDHFRLIGRDPTDAELETIAQTWSEHCGHKTFKAIVISDRVEEPLFTRLKNASNHRDDLTVTKFVDNSGGIKLYEGWVLCGKVETHNSPSAIEPYGGAMTGSGGVFRDIMGTGQGAKLILSTDMFCLAPWNLPADNVPTGCLHPGYLLRNVVRGVMDYGNRMGVPTSNGSFHFHADFRAKPSVIVGAYGLMREEHAQKGEPQVGDKIIAIGGRTGRDGIHGATFSSAEMTDRTINVNSTAVQIGNAIEEQRVSIALLSCRDQGLIRAITDCGAGGFSSAIGEIGSMLGVNVYLERAPLKYSGLAPWEIWISESQERMVAAVAPEHVDAFLETCRSHNVEAVVLGEFTNTEKLFVSYAGEIVCDLSMDFLHNGLPQREMKACWQAPTYTPEPVLPLPTDWLGLLKRVMAHPNVCSRESVVRRYDHGVQGTNALSPYGGVYQDGPNDAVVLRPLADKPFGAIIAHGVNPILCRLNPYWGARWALTEALSNYVAVGGNPREVALIDNFIWPVPNEHHMGGLVMAVNACVDFANAMEVDFVSGKDSLSGTYRGKDGTVIEIPPVLCISAMGRIPDVTKTASTDFKRPGESCIVLRGGAGSCELGGSVYYDVHGVEGNAVPRVRSLEALRLTLNQLHREIMGGDVLACHDISEGGLIVALVEMCIGGDCGAEVYCDNLDPYTRHLQLSTPVMLFNEVPGRFLLEVPEWMTEMGLYSKFCAGKTIPERVLRVMDNPDNRDELFCVSIDELKIAWQAPMKEVF